jgi:hypothetical protein
VSVLRLGTCHPWSAVHLARLSRYFVAVAVGLGATMAFFLIVYPLHGNQVPVGFDTPVYVWWSRFAAVTGLSASALPSRPLIIGVISTLSEVTGIPTAWLISAIGPVLCVATSLTMASLVRRSFGGGRLRFIVTFVLVAIFSTNLVIGYFSTLAFAALFLAGLTCVVDGLIEKRKWTAISGGVLMGTAGLAHPIFLGVGLVWVAGGLLGIALGGDLSAGARRLRMSGSSVMIAIGVALALSFVGLAVTGGLRPGAPTSADRLLREVGLGELLVTAFRRRLIVVLPPFLVVSAVAAILVAATGEWRTSWREPRIRLDPRRDQGVRFLWGMFAFWAAATMVAAILLLLRVDLPAQRLVMFALFAPAIAAVPLSRELRRHRDRLVVAENRAVRDKAAARILLYAVGVSALAINYWIPWWQQDPQISVDAALDVKASAELLATLPRDTPVILVTEQRDPAVLMDQMNSLRAAVPAARATDVHTFIGTPSAFPDTMPPGTGAADQDRIAVYLSRRAVSLTGPSLVMILEGFDPDAYRAALRDGAWIERSDGVLTLGPGSMPVDALRSAGLKAAALSEPGPSPMSPWVPMWAGAVTLAIIVAVGFVWANVVDPASDGLTRLGLAPAVGIAVLGLAAIVVDSLGLKLSGTGSVLAATLAVALGIVGTVVVRSTGRRRGRDPDLSGTGVDVPSR